MTPAQNKKWKFDLQNAAAEITRLAMLADEQSNHLVHTVFSGLSGAFSVSIRERDGWSSRELFGGTALMRPKDSWEEADYESQLAVMKQMRAQLRAVLEGKFKPVAPTGPEAA